MVVPKIVCGRAEGTANTNGSRGCHSQSMTPLTRLYHEIIIFATIGLALLKQSGHQTPSQSIPYQKRKLKMRARLYVLCVVVVLAALIGCKFDFSGLMLSSDPVVEESTVSEIPEKIKELIWQDYEALLTQLLELGIEDAEQVEELLIRIQTRQEQDEYYGKYVDAGGIAIVGAKTLTDEVMLDAQDIALKTTAKRPELRVQLSPETGFYFILTDIAHIGKGFGNVKLLPDWDVWELGLTGLTLINIGMCLTTDGRLVCTAPAAKSMRIHSNPHDKSQCPFPSNLKSSYWCQTEWRRRDWTVFVHEMAHAIHYAVQQIDPTFQSELEIAYENAMEKKLWDKWKVGSGDYAEKNVSEYWAVASEYWFFIHRATSFTTEGKSVEIPEQRRADLKLRDPLIYALLEKWYPAVEPFDETPP